MILSLGRFTTRERRFCGATVRPEPRASTTINRQRPSASKHGDALEALPAPFMSEAPAMGPESRYSPNVRPW